MCKVMEDMRNNLKYDIARNMLKDGVPAEKVAQYSQLLLETVKEIQRTMDASA